MKNRKDMIPKEKLQEYNGCYRVRQLGCIVDTEKKIIGIDEDDFKYWDKLPQSVLFLETKFGYVFKVNRV